MKLLISTKVLHNGLDSFGEGIRTIDQAVIDQRPSGVFYFVLCSATPFHRYDFECESLDKQCQQIYMEGRRWDWVLDLMGNVDEQPVVLDIHPKCVNVIFQY
jgi:hypothetical protein